MHTMRGSVHCRSPLAARLIAADERLREAREAAHQAWLIRESEIAFGKGSDRQLATIRRGIGVALIRAGERLRGAPAASAQASTLSITG
jgi:hypothetical protein